MTKAAKIKVLTVDTRLSMRDSFSRSLATQPEIEIVASVGNSLEAVLRAIELKPQVAIIDLDLPEHGGLVATINTKVKIPEVHILVRNPVDSEEDLMQVFRFGAQGYIPVNARTEDAVKIIQQTNLGEANLHSGILVRLVDEFRQNEEGWNNLSGVEKEVLKLSIEGMPESRIAHSLFITESLVRVLVGRFLERLHHKNQAEAREFLDHMHAVSS